MIVHSLGVFCRNGGGGEPLAVVASGEWQVASSELGGGTHQHNNQTLTCEHYFRIVRNHWQQTVRRVHLVIIFILSCFQQGGVVLVVAVVIAGVECECKWEWK